jgi:(4S)-4-hydroxy-5-phosphonooxypentane-2,3-dione isomerase
MAKLALVATAEIAPGRKGEVLPLLMAHRERCLKSESGTLQFEVLTPYDDDSKVLFYEVYSDDAAFKVHWEGPFVSSGAGGDEGYDHQALRNTVQSPRVTARAD